MIASFVRHVGKGSDPYRKTSLGLDFRGSSLPFRPLFADSQRPAHDRARLSALAEPLACGFELAVGKDALVVQLFERVLGQAFLRGVKLGVSQDAAAV